MTDLLGLLQLDRVLGTNETLGVVDGCRPLITPSQLAAASCCQLLTCKGGREVMVPGNHDKEVDVTTMIQQCAGSVVWSGGFLEMKPVTRVARCGKGNPGGARVGSHMVGISGGEPTLVE